ncbi:MAG: deoxyribodipyrimidine photolyase [Opitutia bacterium Tous-C10FEB]|nr:MAG: deoxyribodipyrimidine photolyase [Opitutae bacterium Tous-C10FEB]
MALTIVWFRQDLRLQDNPALAAALVEGAILPVYIWDEARAGRWPLGGASRWWLHHSLEKLDEALRERGSRLLLAKGESGAVLQDLLKTTGATKVYWNRNYEPAAIACDKIIKATLAAAGVTAQSFNAALLFEPHTIQNKSGRPFQVFTPFWKHCLALPVEDPVKLPRGEFSAPARWPTSLNSAALGLLPTVKWDAGLAAAWQPGEAAAVHRLKKFTSGAIDQYADERNRPDLAGTSSLSPYLHFGEIGPRQIWAAVRARSKDSGVFPTSRGEQVFLSEVGWREFAHHLLYHFPHTPEEPLRSDFTAFPWRSDAPQLQAWQRGRTGYPIVDAGLRQLWATGWMHNRVRMIVASFLVKHLRISWRDGAAWFWDTLLDADLASNTLGWQWTAGCGADAAPYFRIFNPILQGVKFDPEGSYVRRWVPELSRVPTEFLHEPWAAPSAVLAIAGVKLGVDYPQPIVNHGEARVEALAALQAMRAPQI